MSDLVARVEFLIGAGIAHCHTDEETATAVVALVLEAAAKVIEDNQETSSNMPIGPKGDGRHLTPRRNGNLAGLVYADVIRALAHDCR